MKQQNEPISVAATVAASLEKTWKFWTEPEHIARWNHASDDWHSPSAENDLQIGGKFSYRMEAKDGSFGFDFWGVYTNILEKKLIEYTLGDGRSVSITFEQSADAVIVTETFDPESENPVEMQRDGWQMILDNFKKYTETST